MRAYDNTLIISNYLVMMIHSVMSSLQAWAMRWNQFINFVLNILNRTIDTGSTTVHRCMQEHTSMLQFVQNWASQEKNGCQIPF